MPDTEQIAEAYNNILSYLETMATTEDILSNILVFYTVVNRPLTNFSSPQDDYQINAVSHPLSNPYNVSSASIAYVSVHPVTVYSTEM